MGIYKKAHDYLKNLAIKHGGEPRDKDDILPHGFGPKSFAGVDEYALYGKENPRKKRKEQRDSTNIKTHNIKRTKK